MDEPTPSLILIEGLPGSGKSTLAHFLSRRLAAHGIASRWWYEEEAGHPLYLFHDEVSMQKILDDLARGDYQRVIDAALDKWRELSHALRASDAVVILDSCLFGYLTWTLFPYDVPELVIDAYLMHVERIIAGNNPHLIYLHQEDVDGALRKICARRGIATEQRLVRNATESAYGKRRGLRGFDGMVSLWREYRAVTDRAFARVAFPKLAIENSAGDWPAYERAVLIFLGLPETANAGVPVLDLERYMGEYQYRADGADAVCAVLWEHGDLLLDGVPFVWPRNRLVPTGEGTFAVESLPFTVRFEEDGAGIMEKMILTGPQLLSGAVENIFAKKGSEHSQRLGERKHR